MSDLAARTPTADRLALVPEQFKALLAKPLRLLPPEVRASALRVWVCHRHLSGLDTALPLAGLVSVWVDQHALRPADAAACLDRMCDPEFVGRHKFASDLTASLAAEVAAVLRRRKAEAEQQHHRKQADRDAAEAVPRDQWPAGLLDLTQIGRGTRS